MRIIRFISFHDCCDPAIPKLGIGVFVFAVGLPETNAMEAAGAVKPGRSVHAVGSTKDLAQGERGLTLGLPNGEPGLRHAPVIAIACEWWGERSRLSLLWLRTWSRL